MKKPVIAFLIYDDSLMGGAENIALSLADELTNYYDVHVISIFNENKDSHFVHSSKYCHFIVSSKLCSIRLHMFRLSRMIRKYLKQNNVDILLAITAGVNAVAWHAAKNLNTKTVYCEHSNLDNQSYGRNHFYRQKLGATRMDHVVTLTNQDAKNFIDTFSLPQNKVSAIYNWYEKSDLISPTYQINSKKIITVGRIAEVKGYDRLVRIASQVLPYRDDWTWEIYGNGELMETIQAFIDKANLQNKVLLKGATKQIKEKYQEASFYVLTSYYEGLPLVLLEAKAASLPIVAYDCPTGPSEIIRDGINGYLVNNGDEKEMVNKILELIDNKEKRIEFSNHASLDMNKFDKERILQKWIQLIDSML